MATGEPFDRNWIETKILIALNDSKHPILLTDLKGLIPDMGVTIVCTTDKLRREGMVRIFQPSPRNAKYVEITDVGRAVLFHIMTAGRHGCDG